MSSSSVDKTIITKKQAERLQAMCDGSVQPETDLEICFYNAYMLRVDGAPMEYCLENMYPAITDMDIHEIRYFLVGISYAEKDIVEFRSDLDISDDDKNKQYH